MTSELQVKIKRSFLDNYLRPLHLHPEFIMFEDKDLVNDKFTAFKTPDIKEFRYGITWYRYRIVFGREYQLYIRNYNNEVLKIKFNTYFGIKKHGNCPKMKFWKSACPGQKVRLKILSGLKLVILRRILNKIH